MTGPRPRPGEEEFISSYRPDEFPPFAVTVDLAVFTIRAGALSVLLVQRKQHPYQHDWALPGGFVRAHESIETAAYRELGEETGMSDPLDGYLEQLRTYGQPDRDPRMRVVSVAYVALVPNLAEPLPGGDALHARWWPVEDLNLDGTNDPDAPALAFDHPQILSDALERIRAKLEYTTLATRFVTEPFSLADLHRVYKAVWGAAPDLTNFRRKVLSTKGFVQVSKQAGTAAGPTGGRPPLMYQAGTTTKLHPPLLRSQEPDSVR